MTKRKVDAELQARYYQLSREHRALILALAGELATGKQPPSVDKPQSGLPLSGAPVAKLLKGEDLKKE